MLPRSPIHHRALQTTATVALCAGRVCGEIGGGGVAVGTTVTASARMAAPSGIGQGKRGSRTVMAAAPVARVAVEGD